MKITIEVRSSAARFKVALVAESIEGALELATRYNPGKECKVVFPIDPQSFFVGDDLERGGVVGKIAAYAIAIGQVRAPHEAGSNCDEPRISFRAT